MTIKGIEFNSKGIKNPGPMGRDFIGKDSGVFRQLKSFKGLII
jgi:hypothetical protein